MQSYNGIVVSLDDAIILLEASSKSLIPSISRRLTDFERVSSIKSGAVFIWEENSSKIKRWTEGRKWSASRVSGPFLTYKEMQPMKSAHSTAFKYSGLIKQSFSIVTKDGRNLHLVSYLDNSYLNNVDQNTNEDLVRPSLDPMFKSLAVDISQYPKSLIENTIFKNTEKRKLDDTITDLNQQCSRTLKRRKSCSASTISLISCTSMPHSPLSSESESESDFETFSKLLEFTASTNPGSLSVSTLPVELTKSNSLGSLRSLSPSSKILPRLSTNSPPLSILLNIDTRTAIGNNLIHRSLVNEDDKLLGCLDRRFI